MASSLIADEIQTGFARTGKMFAMEHHGVAPDLTTMAKGLAGGFPLAAVTGRASVMDAANPGGLGGTYGGNPIGIARGARGARRDRGRGPVRPRHATGQPSQNSGCRRSARTCRRSSTSRGPGFMNAIEFNDVKTGKPSPDFTNCSEVACAGEGPHFSSHAAFTPMSSASLSPVNHPGRGVQEALDLLEAVHS